MGLDMYLERDTYIKNWEHNGNPWTVDIRKNGVPLNLYNPTSITEQVGYWRKANHIHKWFVDNVQDSKDECQRSFVSLEQLQELLNVCEQVLADHDLASELLPTNSGFFFGATEYDEYYFEDIQETVVILTRVLATTDTAWGHQTLYYQASW